MSKDSSDVAKKALPSYKTWRVASLALFGSVMLYFSAQIIGGLIVSLVPALHHWSAAQTTSWLTNSTLAQFSYGLLADSLMVGGVALFLKFFRWRWSTIGLTLPLWRQIAVGIVAAVPYYTIYILTVVIVSDLVPSLNVSQKQEIGFSSVHGLVPLILTFISLVVIPPLAEEITVRGFLYTGLKRWLPSLAAGLVVSVLFGAAHLAEGGAAGPLWIGALDTFVLSVVLVFLREKTGSLWAGITLHAIKNGVAFISIFIVGSH